MADVFAKNAATSAEEAAKIVPRAEFRVFGKDVIAGVIDHMWKCKAQLFKARVMPPETYILSKKTNDANVKVRDGLLDIKTKTSETPEGFEVFQPRGKFQFPVQRPNSPSFSKTSASKRRLRRTRTPLTNSAPSRRLILTSRSLKSKSAATAFP